MESKGNSNAPKQKLLKILSEAENTVKVKGVIQPHRDDTVRSTCAAERC